MWCMLYAMGYYSVSEIEAKITEIDAAYTKTLEAQQYSINTGQGSQSVMRAELAKLSKERDYWLSLYAEETDTDPALVSLRFAR